MIDLIFTPVFFQKIDLFHTKTFIFLIEEKSDRFEIEWKILFSSH